MNRITPAVSALRFLIRQLAIGNRQSSRGIIVPTITIIMIILTISALSLVTFSINHTNRLNTSVFATSALLSAEAGAEQTLHELNQDSNFAGYGTEQQLFSNQTQGRGTYETSVTEGSLDNEKHILSIGRVYQRPADTTPKVTRKVKLTVVGTTTGGYSVHTGPGGLIMKNSATIANGEVFINGYLRMENSSRIGSENQPIDVNVAHYDCPAGGPTYPILCTSGEPIDMNNTAHIYGDVRANGQIDGSQMSNNGLIVGSTVEPVALPGYDRQAQIDNVATTIDESAASCKKNETRTWAANTHVTGNVEVLNNCLVTVEGDVWIDGELELRNAATLQVAESVTEQPTIMVDGEHLHLHNDASVIANSQKIGIQFITYKSEAACSPGCSDVTGDDLYNTRDINTIELKNNSLAAGSIFYSRWSKITVKNSGSVGAIIGQTIELHNTGNISFGTQLSSGQNIWTIKTYQQIFD